MSGRSLFLACILILAASWALQGIVLGFAGGPAAPGAVPWMIGAMYTPALVALGFAWRDRAARAALLWRPTWACVPLIFVAVVVPVLVAFGTVAVVESAGWGSSSWFAFSAAGVDVLRGPWLLDDGAQEWLRFAGNVLATGLAYSFVSAAATSGEELGWRGLLQSEFVRRFGITGGIVLLGLVWWLFHVPVLLAGFNFPEAPMLGTFVIFPAELIAFSFFFGWLTIKARSFWPAAIGHGAMNSIGDGVTRQLSLDGSQLPLYFTSMGLVVAFGVVFWLLLLLSKSGTSP